MVPVQANGVTLSHHSIWRGVNVGRWSMGLGRGNMSATFRAVWRPEMGRSGDGGPPALRHGAGVAAAAGIAIPIRDVDFGEDEDLIVFWKDDGLLNALGGITQDADSPPVPFDVPADHQLVELLLAWRMGFDPFRDSTRAMNWTLNRRRSAEDAPPDRGDGERVGICPAWAGEESLRPIPMSLLLASHLNTQLENQRQGRSPNGWRNAQIARLTRERGLGR